MNTRRTATSVRTAGSHPSPAQRSFLSLLALASAIFLAAALLPPTPAHGQALCSPTNHESLRADTYRYQPGDTMRVTGAGYAASCSVTLRLSGPDSANASTVVATDGDGNLAGAFTLGTVMGEYTVAAYMGGSDPRVSITVTNGAYVEPDLPAYTPRDNVTLRGAGWQPGETVAIAVDELDDVGNLSNALNTSALADASGKFSNSAFTPDNLDAGIDFRALATGQASGRSALTFFEVLQPPPPPPTNRTLGEAVMTLGMYPAGAPVQFSGLNFVPNVAVTLHLVLPDGSSADLPVTTDGKGTFALTYQPITQGTYTGAALGPGGVWLTAIGFSSGATLYTGQGDYSPGQTVRIFGEMWQSGETVSLLLQDKGAPRVRPDRNATTVADASGNLDSADFVMEEADRGLSLALTATGQSSGIVRQASFTDSASTDCFRSAKSGNWNAASSWESAAAPACTTFLPATFGPSSSATNITIRSGHTVTVSANQSAKNLTVASGGDLEINNPNSLIVTRAGGTDLTIGGTVNVFGNLTMQVSTSGSIAEILGGGVLTIKSGGLLNGSGGNAATRSALTVDSGGQWTIDPVASLNAGGPGGMQLTINAGGTASLNGPVTAGTTAIPTTFNGTVNSTSTISIVGSADLEIGGNVSFGGAVTVGSGSSTMNVASTGTVTSSANITIASVSNLQVSGTLTMTGSSTLTVNRGNGGTMGSINNGGSVNLQDSSLFLLGGVSTSSYTLASGGTLDVGPNAAVNGISILLTNAGSNIKIGSAFGVNSAITSQTNFNVGTNWTFDGPAAQATGTNFPANVGNLTIANASGAVTLTNGTETISGTLTVQTGATLAKTGTLTLNLGAGGVANAGTIRLHGNAACGGSDNIALRSTSSGTQRPWSGAGTFDIFDASVQDQGGTASILALSSTSVSNNGASWTFIGGCVASFTVGGSLSGLGASKSVVLQDNGGDNLSLSSSGGFTFATAVNAGGSYAVTVSTQPTGQTCSVANGSGSNVQANVTTVSVSCTDNTYTLTYTGSANCSIGGTSPQTVIYGASGGAVSAVPAAGYHFVQWSDGSIANPRTDSNVTADIAVTASCAINTYTLSYAAGTNGSLTGTASQTVDYGASGTAVTAAPDLGYHFVHWSDGSTDNPRTDSNVTMDISVTAGFAINTYTLTYTGSANCAIGGSSPQTVDYGASGSAVSAAPDVGYHFVQWSDSSTDNPRTDSNVTADVSVTATCAINTYTLAYAAGAHGSLAGTTSQTVDYGSDGLPVATVADTGYHFVQWSDGSTDDPRTDSNVTADISVTASFAINTYTITATAGANGIIAPPGAVGASYGDTPQFTLTPDPGYAIDTGATGSSCGGSLAGNLWTTDPIVANCFVSAAFAIIAPTETFETGDLTHLPWIADGDAPWTVQNVVRHNDFYAARAGALPGRNQHSSLEVTLNIQDAGTVYFWLKVSSAPGDALRFYIDDVAQGAPYGWSGEVDWTFVGYPVTTGIHTFTWEYETAATGSPAGSNTAWLDNITFPSYLTVQHTVTPSAGAGGSIAPSTPQMVYHGFTTSFTVTHDTGYHIDSVTGCGGSLSGNTYTTGAITADCAVTAAFAINSYTLSYAAGASGSITGSTPQTVNYGGSGTTVTAAPNVGFHFVSWSDGVTTASRTDLNVTANISVTATFAGNGFAFSGFFPPVSNAPTLNSQKAGSAVPVKFSLGGSQGLNIFAAGYPASQQIDCNSLAPIGAMTPIATAGQSGLQYDAASGQYTYVWKTDKAWAGTCRKLIVQFSDGAGTTKFAVFKFN